MDTIIKHHLTEYAKSKGWDSDDKTLFEIAREANEVYRIKTSSHRWYDDHFVVVEVNGMLIGLNDFYMTGDNNAEDMGIDYDYDSLCQVKAVEKTITVYEKL